MKGQFRCSKSVVQKVVNSGTESSLGYCVLTADIHGIVAFATRCRTPNSQ